MKCFGKSVCPVLHLEGLHSLGDCEVKEECADYSVNHEGWEDAVVVIEEKDDETNHATKGAVGLVEEKP